LELFDITSVDRGHRLAKRVIIGAAHSMIVQKESS
jgi:hypothetical protein